MSRPVISVHNLGKEYVIGARADRNATFAETLTATISAPFQRLRRLQGKVEPAERIWALKDVSFEVEQGEVVGIIGRNGAGKSTLLKVLSRITSPTEGRIEIRGRVASLLEVGTGFHGELTGRENIYLNGAILGMSRTEITRKFDEIVDFAGVEQFIDTPVKRYSSGMYLRLAFSVAAHLEPEILIVDEVLAVGDAEFQRKCLGKMREVSGEGRTVLFVSHNTAAVSDLCSEGVLLDHGRVRARGSVPVVLAQYLRTQPRRLNTSNSGWRYRNRGSVVRLERVTVNGRDDHQVLHSGDPCSIRVEYRCLDPRWIGSRLSVSLVFVANDAELTNLWTDYRRETRVEISAIGFVECDIPRWPFRSLDVQVTAYTHIGDMVQDWVEGCLTIESADGDFYGSGVSTGAGDGTIFVEHGWASGAR